MTGQAKRLTNKTFLTTSSFTAGGFFILASHHPLEVPKLKQGSRASDASADSAFPVSVGICQV